LRSCSEVSVLILSDLISTFPTMCQPRFAKFYDHRCMTQVEEFEERTNNKFDLVMRVRDDGFAMDDWVVDSEYAHGFSTLDCQQWTGLHDMSYVMGRKYASEVLHAMIDWRADKTLLHDKLPSQERYPQNPERWLLAIVTAFHLPIRKLSVCDIPMVTTRFVKGMGVIDI
jgi:hypothetical protein